MDKFILYNTSDGKASIKLYAENNTVWLSQAQIVELFNSSKSNISEHIKHIFEEHELEENSVVRNFRTTASDGKQYNVAYYNLDMILAIGFRVRSVRGTQFRKWANTTLKEYLLKGFVMDDERLKNPDGRPDYFDELLERIRDIRASEKRFYQKLRDLFALSSDYISSDKETMAFFSATQNKLIYGVTGMTAAELVVARADSSKPNMALTNWQGSVVRKADIYTSKNYLTHDELDILNRLVTVFLETAELRVKIHKDLTIKYWKETVDKLITDNGISLLKNKGSISQETMRSIVAKRYDEFDFLRKQAEAKEADFADLKEIEAEIKALGSSKK